MKKEFKKLSPPNDNVKERFEEYERNYKIFISKLNKVARFEPKSMYLHAIMDSVAFKDTQTALDIAIKHKSNSKGR